jgi:hypothetical protein
MCQLSLSDYFKSDILVVPVWKLDIVSNIYCTSLIACCLLVVASVWILLKAATADINIRFTFHVIQPYCKTSLDLLFPCADPQTSWHMDPKHFFPCWGYAKSRIEPRTHPTGDNLARERVENEAGAGLQMYLVGAFQVSQWKRFSLL